MQLFEGKRLEFIGVKYNENEKALFEEIGKKLDRPLSYVVRELSLRGLAAYLEDNNLRMTGNEVVKSKDLLERANITEVEVLDANQSNISQSQKKKTGFALFFMIINCKQNASIIIAMELLQ